MQLDFTAIRGNLAEKPLEAPVTAFNRKDSIEVPTGAKSPQKALQRATEGEEKVFCLECWEFCGYVANM